MALPVQLVTPSGPIDGWTRDLSFEGVGIELTGAQGQTIRRTGSIQVRFEPDRVRIRLPAIVTYRDETRIGLRFGPYTVTAGIYIGERLLYAEDHNQ